MTNLTKQWKKGELPAGFSYYTTIFSPTVYIQNFTIDVINFQDFKETVAEVLAPVPSYQEYLESESHCAVYSEINQWNKEEISAFKRRVEELKEENNKLKELLMSARNYLKSYRDLYSKDNEDIVDFIKEIDQVLANNKIQANTIACNKIQEKNNGFKRKNCR